MGAAGVIGHIDCPVCGHEMPVKQDKNKHAYGHCAHRCNAQVFTRNDHRDSLLRQRMRPVTVTDTVTAPKADEPGPVAVPVFVPPVPTPAPAPKPAAPPKPVPPKPEAKQRANWFSPVLGVKNGHA